MFKFNVPDDLAVPTSPECFDATAAFGAVAVSLEPLVLSDTSSMFEEDDQTPDSNQPLFEMFQARKDASSSDCYSHDFIVCTDVHTLAEESARAKERDVPIFKASGLSLVLLQDSICANLAHVQQLTLSMNQLSDLPAQMSQLQRLHSLMLNNNRLQCFPEVLLRLTTLKSLNLCENNITVVPHAISVLSQLQLLHLGRCGITALPTSIGRLKLRELDLRDNMLTSVPSSLCRMPLTMLDLAHNKLENLPAELGMLTDLRCLALDGNQLERLPSSIGNLTNLWELDVSSNELSSLPHGLGRLAFNDMSNGGFVPNSSRFSVFKVLPNPFDDLPADVTEDRVAILRHVLRHVRDVCVSSSTFQTDMYNMVDNPIGSQGLVIPSHQIHIHMGILRDRAYQCPHVIENFISLSDGKLRDPQLDVLTIRSVLQFLYTGAPEYLTTEARSLMNPQFVKLGEERREELHGYHWLLKCNEEADVTFIVEGQLVRCHAAVICGRSAFFETMFSGNFSERMEEKVFLEDTPYLAFMAVLSYMYTDDEKDITADNVVQILILANRYTLPRLVELCELFVHENIEVDDDETLIAMYLLSQQHNAIQLATVYSHAILNSENYSTIIERDELSEYKETLREEYHQYLFDSTTDSMFQFAPPVNLFVGPNSKQTDTDLDPDINAGPKKKSLSK